LGAGERAGFVASMRTADTEIARGERGAALEVLVAELDVGYDIDVPWRPTSDRLIQLWRPARR
jgi:hypothetical protein